MFQKHTLPDDPALVNMNKSPLKIGHVCIFWLSDNRFVSHRTIHSRHHSRPTEHDKEEDTRSEASNRQPKGDIIGDDLPSALIEASMHAAVSCLVHPWKFVASLLPAPPRLFLQVPVCIPQQLLPASLSVIMHACSTAALCILF